MKGVASNLLQPYFQHKRSMTNLHFLLLALIMGTCLKSASAQGVQEKIVWGEDMSKKPKSLVNSLHIFSHDSGHVSYVAKYKKLGPLVTRERMTRAWKQTAIRYVLEEYDREQNLVRSVEFPMGYKGEKRIIEAMIYRKGHILVFSSLFNKKRKENSLYLETVDPRTLRTNRDIRQLLQTRVQITRDENRFRFEMSPDSTKCLIYHEKNRPFSKVREIGLLVVDEDREILMNQDIELEYRANKYFLDEYWISNLGRVYIGGRMMEKPIKSLGPIGEGIPLFDLFETDVPATYTIFEFNETGNRKTIELDIGDSFAEKCMCEPMPDGNLKCIGFYSDRGFRSFRGAFTAIVNVFTEETQLLDKQQFSQAFIRSMHKKQGKPKKKKKASRKETPTPEEEESLRHKELTNFRINDLITKPDGGYFLVAEYYVEYSFNYTAGSNNMSYSKPAYAQFDLLVIQVSPDGKIDWNLRIAKHQNIISGSRFDSYIHALNGDRLFILFNDHKGNLKEKAPKQPLNMGKTSEDAVTTMIVIDPDGAYNKTGISQGTSTRMRPLLSRQISETEMLIFAAIRDGYKWGKLVLE